RSSDSRGHDRAATGHRLEQRLAERLHEARLGKDAALREQTWNLVVRDAPKQADALTVLQAGPQRAVADEGERSLAQACERVGEADHVLPFVERADAEEARRAGRRIGDREPQAVDAARHDLDLPAHFGELRLEL